MTDKPLHMLIYVCIDEGDCRAKRKELEDKMVLEIDMPKMITINKAEEERTNLFSELLMVTEKSREKVQRKQIEMFNAIHEKLKQEGKLTGKSVKNQKKIIQKYLKENPKEAWKSIFRKKTLLDRIGVK